MTEVWAPALEFPDYSVSNHGRVRKDNTGRMLTQFTNRQGVLYVSPFLNKVQCSRSVRRLVAECFLESPRNSSFDTPINVDGDVTNNRADNLMWRPRWFSIKYMRQFREDPKGRNLLVYDTETGEEMTCWAAALRYGLLWREVYWRASTQIEEQKAVWPTGQIFQVSFMRTY
jgi:hypothetical protein